MKTLILGGGLAGLSLASQLKDPSVVLEKEEVPGGLCRSFDFRGVTFDIGPHILFSKDKEALAALTALCPTAELKRSNKVLHAGRLVKYPFENELSALDPAERDYCLREFLENPYEDLPASNMLQFFLKTFGEGITRLYLQPYNEKIWKFDPAFMDTQMVDRIPKPPKEDIINSARGAASEGYQHQLYFRYPVSGGTSSLVSGLAARLRGKAEVVTGAEVLEISRRGTGWAVRTAKGEFTGDRLINCMPLHELFRCLEAPAPVKAALQGLKYNSIHVVHVRARKDSLGDNFALNSAQKDVAFHRLSKIDFLGPAYRSPEGTTIAAEITFRPGAAADAASVIEAAVSGLDRLGLVKRADVLAAQVSTFKYAYVIYDLNHRANTDAVLGHLRESGIRCCGRFAEFEYLNMDAVMRRTITLAAELNAGN